jgi:hypothetical protein
MDEVGWDGVILFFIVFTLSVKDKRREKWDKSIPEKSQISSSHFVKHID